MSKIEIDLEEAKEVFLLFERLQEFLHQPMNYDSGEKLEEFVCSIYPDIADAYYKTIWNWLPRDIQKEIEER